MPWQKTFDSDATLQKAMEAFWARGYEATSMQDLVDCMGIGRGSLYATFGDKRTLFIQALRRYDQRHRRDWTARLAAEASPRAAILAVFDEVIQGALAGDGRKGCLLVNTALELSAHDEQVAGIVSQGLTEMEAFFADRLVRAKTTGEVPEHVIPGETAKALLALLVGMRVFTRARPERALLTAVATQAQALIS